MVAGTLETLHEGYTTDDAYYWICAICFEDFRDMFGWTVNALEDTRTGFNPESR
jgi:hypothetical protein